MKTRVLMYLAVMASLVTLAMVGCSSSGNPPESLVGPSESAPVVGSTKLTASASAYGEIRFTAPFVFVLIEGNQAGKTFDLQLWDKGAYGTDRPANGVPLDVFRNVQSGQSFDISQYACHDIQFDLVAAGGGLLRAHHEAAWGQCPVDHHGPLTCTLVGGITLSATPTDLGTSVSFVLAAADVHGFIQGIFTVNGQPITSPYVVQKTQVIQYITVHFTPKGIQNCDPTETLVVSPLKNPIDPTCGPETFPCPEPSPSPTPTPSPTPSPSPTPTPEPTPTPTPTCSTATYNGSSTFTLDNSGDATELAWVNTNVLGGPWNGPTKIDEPGGTSWTSTGNYPVVLIKSAQVYAIYINVHTGDVLQSQAFNKKGVRQDISHVSIFVCAS